MALAQAPASMTVAPSNFRRSMNVIRDPLRRSASAGIFRLAIFRNRHLQTQALAPRHCFLDPRSSSSTTSKEAVEKRRLFEEWLRTLGNESCNLVLRKTSHGFGTVAGPGGVEKGAIVVRVPQKAFMSAETAKQCAILGPLIRRHRLNDWQALLLHLLWEREKGSGSFWAPYISMLPPQATGDGSHPLSWDESCRGVWLAGSPLLNILHHRIAQCREDAAALVHAGANEVAPPVLHPLVSAESVVWAAATLLSRAFSLDTHPESAAGGVVTLVPWADMLNHSGEAGGESCLRFHPPLGAATLRSHRRYEEGEEVEDSYGPTLTAGELLLDYGFVEAERRNDAINLMASCLGPVQSSANSSLLDSVGLSVDASVFTFTPAGPDASVRTWMRAALASASELEAGGWGGGGVGRREGCAFSTFAYFAALKSTSLEKKVNVRMLAAATSALHGYPTSVAEDEQLLLKGVFAKAAAESCLRALMSEKRALIGTIHKLSTSLAQL